MMIRCPLARVSLSTAVAAGAWLAACGDGASQGTPPVDAAIKSDAAIPPDAATPLDALQIKTLSNRADLISGGDALVEIVIPPGSPSGSVHVTAGATDVSAAFSRRPDGRTLGVITGLAGGSTEIKADLGGKQGASLTVTNHPVGGPVFSGAQITPWICASPLGAAQVGDDPGSFDSGLSNPATDGQCDAPTEFQLFYRTTGTPGVDCDLVLANLPQARPGVPTTPNPPPKTPCFQPFDPSGPTPGNIAMTTTDTGVTVPYIVRVERLTLNRGIGDIAVLFDPSQGDKDHWNPLAPQTTWNRKMLYVFGPATNQPRFQKRSTQLWPAQDEALKRGFLVAVNGLTDSSQNSNRMTMTETVMMMKEHIIDSYGEMRYSMGAGCSGGSLNQLSMTSIYPGLLDGLQPSCTYPDSETTGIEVSDCELLVRFYASPEWKGLLTSEGLIAQDAAKQAAINGHLDNHGCQSWFNSFIGVARPGNYVPERVDLVTGVISQRPPEINNCGLPTTVVYDPQTRKGAPRCTAQDHAVSVWGTVDDSVHPKHAPSTRDNVGVVYGLKALQSGAITPTEFVVLNEKIGGADFDVNRTDTRSVADPTALDIAYRAGIVMDGRHVAKTPILDLRGFDEQGIHYIWRSFSLRARLDAAGGHGNHVLWRFSGSLTPTAASGLTLASFLAMDKWLAAVRADTGARTLEQKIVADKPTEGFDFCYLSNDAKFQRKVTDQAQCDLDPGLRPHSSPRQVAGGPVTEDILKCQLKPFNPDDYPRVQVDLDTHLIDRLKNAFPDGVCDWSRAGVGQQPAVSPLDFTAGPGGVALPAAPVSHAL
jgi:hypothetical protein